MAHRSAPSVPGSPLGEVAGSFPNAAPVGGQRVTVNNPGNEVLLGQGHTRLTSGLPAWVVSIFVHTGSAGKHEERTQVQLGVDPDCCGAACGRLVPGSKGRKREIREVACRGRAWSSELQRQPHAGGMRAGVLVQPGAAVFGLHLQESTRLGEDSEGGRGLVDGLGLGLAGRGKK